MTRPSGPMSSNFMVVKLVCLSMNGAMPGNGDGIVTTSMRANRPEPHRNCPMKDRDPGHTPLLGLGILVFACRFLLFQHLKALGNQVVDMVPDPFRSARRSLMTISHIFLPASVSVLRVTLIRCSFHDN
jgi:hypothetical protein